MKDETMQSFSKKVDKTLAENIMGWYLDDGVWFDHFDNEVATFETFCDCEECQNLIWSPFNHIKEAFDLETKIPTILLPAYGTNLIKILENDLKHLPTEWEIAHASASQRAVAAYHLFNRS